MKAEEFLPIFEKTRPFKCPRDFDSEILFSQEEIFEFAEAYHQSRINAMTVNLKNNDERYAYLIGIEHERQRWESRVNAITDEEIDRETQIYQSTKQYNFGVLHGIKWFKNQLLKQECEHKDKTWNEDIGAYVCDNCNDKMNY